MSKQLLCTATIEVWDEIDGEYDETPTITKILNHLELGVDAVANNLKQIYPAATIVTK